VTRTPLLATAAATGLVLVLALWLPLVTLKEPVFTPIQRMTKRAFDLLVTTVFMIPALPVMAMIALAIKLEDGGPVLFNQERVGEGRRTFKMCKFRSMRTLDNGNVVKQATKDDPRITRFGTIIDRKSVV